MTWITRLSAVVLPLLLTAAGTMAMARKHDVFTLLTDGAASGLRTVAKLLPTLCALLCAVSMLRASGLTEQLASLLAPVLESVGIPPELTLLMLVRPLSGSGALAAAAEVMERSGPDSTAGRMAAVMLASSETTLYTAAVYFGAAGIRRTRYAVLAAFAAESAAFLASAAAVRLIWG